MLEQLPVEMRPMSGGRVFSKEIPKKIRAPAARDQFHSYLTQKLPENRMNSGVDSAASQCKGISFFFVKETIVQQRYRSTKSFVNKSC